MIRFSSRYFSWLNYFLLISLWFLLSLSALSSSNRWSLSWNSLWLSSCRSLRLCLGLLCQTYFIFRFLRITSCCTLMLALRFSFIFSNGRLFLGLLAHSSFNNLLSLFSHQWLLSSSLSSRLAFDWFAFALWGFGRFLCGLSALGSSSLDLRKLSDAFGMMLSCFLGWKELARRSASFFFAGWDWSCISIPGFPYDLALNSLLSWLFLFF